MCTLWAANGTIVRGEGSLIAKNRDYELAAGVKTPQVFQLISNEDKLSYAAIQVFFSAKQEKGIAEAGLNEKGLAVVLSEAAYLESNTLFKYDAPVDTVGYVLETYESVDDFIENIDSKKFRKSCNLMLADSEKICRIEIYTGDGGEVQYQYTTCTNGYLAQANSYIEPGLIGYCENTENPPMQEIINNASNGDLSHGSGGISSDTTSEITFNSNQGINSSNARLERISDLLSQHSSSNPLTLNDFETFCYDQIVPTSPFSFKTNNPDDACDFVLCRTVPIGKTSPPYALTLFHWIVYLPPRSPPHDLL